MSSAARLTSKYTAVHMAAHQFSWRARTVAKFFAWTVIKPLYFVTELMGRTDNLWRWVGRKMHEDVVAGNDFGDYVPRVTDVIVCTFPKCGTNWTLQIAHQIATRCQGEFEHIHHVVPWPDFKHQHMIAPLSDRTVLDASPTGLRVIKTHFEFTKVPYTDDARYIYILRDPKDAFVSSYHFIREVYFGPIMPPVDVWLRLYCSDDFPFDWAEHVHSYWQNRNRPNFLILTYEDMKADASASIARIAQFMSVDMSPAELETVADRSGFSYMKAIGSKFSPPAMTPLAEHERTMIRRGESGGSSELLSAAQQLAIDDCMRHRLAKLGSDFPYDEFYGTAAAR